MCLVGIYTSLYGGVSEKCNDLLRFLPALPSPVTAAKKNAFRSYIQGVYSLNNQIIVLFRHLLGSMLLKIIKIFKMAAKT